MYHDASWYEQIGRMTGLALNGGDPIIHYATTGGGRNITQTWGDGKVKLDYNSIDDNPNPSLLDRFGRIKTMDIRKMTGPTTSTPIHKYEYGYDANGNRTYARIKQAGNDPGDPGYNNNRSYLYGYDRLNRLTYAERGVLKGTNDGMYDGGKGRAWGLDLLGNWSGDLDSNERVENRAMPTSTSILSIVSLGVLACALGLWRDHLIRKAGMSLRERALAECRECGLAGSANNRLMFYATYNTSGQSRGLASTTCHFSNDLGHVARVVTDKDDTDTGERQLDPTWLAYAKSGSTVCSALAVRVRRTLFIPITQLQRPSPVRMQGQRTAGAHCGSADARG